MGLHGLQPLDLDAPVLPRQLLRGRRLRRLGRQAPADRGGVGARARRTRGPERVRSQLYDARLAMDRQRLPRPTRASRRPRARSASTTASSWWARWCCAAAPASRPPAMRAPPTATSSTRTSAGCSPACGWPRTRRGRDGAAEDADAFRRDVLGGPGAAAEVDPAEWFYDARGSEPVRGDHRAAGILPDPHRDRAADADRAGDRRARSRTARCWSSSAAAPAPRPGCCSTPRRSWPPTRRSTSAPRRWRRRPRRSARDYPDLVVEPLARDFTRALGLPPAAAAGRPRVGFFPGSTIGNFDPGRGACGCWPRRARLLGEDGALHPGRRPGEGGGADDAAYDDAPGVTAAFNKNLLARINRELGGDFDLRRVRPPGGLERRSTAAWRCTWSAVRRPDGRTWPAARFDFAAGESLHTENSYKFTVEDVTGMAQARRLAADRPLDRRRRRPSRSSCSGRGRRSDRYASADAPPGLRAARQRFASGLSARRACGTDGDRRRGTPRRPCGRRWRPGRGPGRSCASRSARWRRPCGRSRAAVPGPWPRSRAGWGAAAFVLVHVHDLLFSFTVVCLAPSMVSWPSVVGVAGVRRLGGKLLRDAAGLVFRRRNFGRQRRGPSDLARVFSSLLTRRER